MPRYANVSAGILILPDGEAIAPGGVADIEDPEANKGVADWIASGALGEKKRGRPKKEPLDGADD